MKRRDASLPTSAAYCLVHVGHQNFKEKKSFSGSIRVCLGVKVLKLENVCIYCSRLFYCAQH